MSAIYVLRLSTRYPG